MKTAHATPENDYYNVSISNYPGTIKPKMLWDKPHFFSSEIAMKKWAHETFADGVTVRFFRRVNEIAAFKVIDKDRAERLEVAA